MIGEGDSSEVKAVRGGVYLLFLLVYGPRIFYSEIDTRYSGVCYKKVP